jgi:gamma-tubulin complex component 3
MQQQLNELKRFYGDALTENLMQTFTQSKEDQQQKEEAPCLAETPKQAYAQALATEEGIILRELLYIMQGISGDRLVLHGQHLQFQSWALQTLLPPDMLHRSLLGSGAKDTLHLCGEAGWLYSRIKSYAVSPKHGSVARALAMAMDTELDSYRAWLTSVQPHHLHLILVESRRPLARLKILALLTDGLALFDGGPLLSALYAHSRHGDTRHAQLASYLLTTAAKPWFELLYAWIRQGLLSSSEFFVQEIETVADRDLWRKRYSLVQAKVPVGSIDQDLVEPVFQIGKGINYIRKCLLDEGWSMNLELTNIETNTANSMESSMDATESQRVRAFVVLASKLVHSRILESLWRDYSLMDHLFALKQFLLLGQGDFFSALMDGIHAAYGQNQGVVGIYRHDLEGIVDTSLKSTNAMDFSRDMLERLQVRLMLDPDEGTQFMFAEPKGSSVSADTRTVWDCFLLEYVVPDPLVAIVDTSAMQCYQDMFLLLFGVKKVDYLLNYTWRMSATLQHALQTSAQYNAIKVKTSPAYAQAIILLRKVAMTRQSMFHFVGNLKSYLLFEVLEGGWKGLVRQIESAQSLDDVVHAHEEYLNGICRKSLLRSTVEEDALGKHVKGLLRLSYEFCTYQQDLFGLALEFAEVAAGKRREAEERQDQCDWGFIDKTEMTEEETFFGLSDASRLHELDVLSDVFHDRIQVLIAGIERKLDGGHVSEPRDPLTPTTGVLEIQDNADDRDDLDSLRFLKFQLDQNAYYQARMTQRLP